MPTLSKIQSGFIYNEGFDDSGIVWQVLPKDSDRFSKDGNRFLMQPGEERLSIVTEMPDGNFIMKIHFNHQPLSNNSFAGVVVIKDKDSRVECQTYRSLTEIKTIKKYQYIKVIRKINKYLFYASLNEQKWELVGAARLDDANLIGFYFQTDDSNESPVEIDSIKFYKSNTISFLGLEQNSKIVIKEETGISKVFHVITQEERNRCDIDLTLTEAPFINHRLQVLNPKGLYLMNEEFSEIQGGDVFSVGFNYDIYLNKTESDPGTLLKAGEITDLGRLLDIRQLNSLTIINEDEHYIPKNIIVRIERYSPYFKGEDCVQLGVVNLNEPIKWAKQIIIPQLLYQDPVKIMMEIEKDTDAAAPFTSMSYMYKIIIE
jgi:hypothetical protein